jgi:branched-chain amino acid transport system substrate-binding protein
MLPEPLQETTMRLHFVVQAVGLGLAIWASAAPNTFASSDNIKIGYITDLSGVYADSDGLGGVAAVRMAIADFGGKVNGKPIELLSVDNQNKPAVAASQAREWFDRDGVDVILGGTNSGVALATNRIAVEKKKLYISIGAGTDRLTNEECSGYTIHYAYDTTALAKVVGSAVTKEPGSKTWYFVTADYAFGKSLEKAASEVVSANGGRVVGGVRHPLSTSDFSSFVLQAQASRAQVLALANGGGDTVNSIKSAKQFGIDKSMKIAALLIFISDVHSLGLTDAQGLLLTDSWYWNQSDSSRIWARRYFDKVKKMPGSLQAADYSATMNWLKAVQSVGSTDPDKIVAQLKKVGIDDFYARGYIRQDGLMIHNMYLFEVKRPAESSNPWDYYRLLATVPGEQAFATKAETRCEMWK